MLFFLIELDEERILKDDLIDLEAAYECIDETFAQEGITLYQKKDAVRAYVRNIDEHDFEYLWYMNELFKEESWFCYYVKQWRFLDVDDETGRVYEDEDVLAEWVEVRPVLSEVQESFKS